MNWVRAKVLILLVMMAMLSPHLAIGLQAGLNDCAYPTATTMQPDHPTNLPSPCEQQGGKRVIPERPRLQARLTIELPRATAAQWELGLADDPLRKGTGPATELKPPRSA